MDLQTALLAILPAIQPPPIPPQPKAKAKAKLASQPRRLAVGSFDCGRKTGFDTTGEFNRPDPSQPPRRGLRSNWPSPT